MLCQKCCVLLRLLRLLQNIEEVYPGPKELLINKGLSAQAQDRYMQGTAIDQRGKQTINRGAKTTGGIKSFSFSDSSDLKWTLNRSEQARNTTELLSLAGTKSSLDMYKQLRPSQILTLQAPGGEVFSTSSPVNGSELQTGASHYLETW